MRIHQGGAPHPPEPECGMAGEAVRRSSSVRRGEHVVDQRHESVADGNGCVHADPRRDVVDPGEEVASDENEQGEEHERPPRRCQFILLGELVPLVQPSEQEGDTEHSAGNDCPPARVGHSLGSPLHLLDDGFDELGFTQAQRNLPCEDEGEDVQDRVPDLRGDLVRLDTLTNRLGQDREEKPRNRASKRRDQFGRFHESSRCVR